MKFNIRMTQFYSENYWCELLSWSISIGGIIRSDKAGTPKKITTINLRDKTRVNGRYTNKRIKL